MTDLNPRIVLGTMHFGTKIPTEQAHELLDAYVDLGGEWIDTANCYAFWGSDTGHGGQSETVIGQWLASRDNRDWVKISTKVGAEPLRPGSFPDAVEGLTQPIIHDALRCSLSRLNTDHVDLYWAHKEDRTQTIPAITETFGSLVTAGLTTNIGLSNHPAWYFAAANTHAAETSRPQFAAAQLRESYLHPRPDVVVDGQDHPNGMMTPETKDFATAFGISLWAYTPLLTGAYEHPDRPLPTAYDHPGTRARLSTLHALAHELGAKPSQVVLAWLLAHRITPIVGVSNTRQIGDAIQAASLELPADALTKLDAAS